MIGSIKQELKELEHFSVESIGDIAHIMKQKDKLTKNAVDHGADGHSRNGVAVDIHHSLDHQRAVVAICGLGLRGNPVGHCCIGLLLPPCCLYLPRMPRGIQTSLQGNVLGISHAQDAPRDLPQVRS